MHLPTVLTSFIHTGLGILIMMLSMALLIIIHEGGHWIVARLLGFQTPVFCIGFGPRKWSIVLGKFWQTEFRLSPILAGGYVALPEMQDETLPPSSCWKSRARTATQCVSSPYGSALPWHLPALPST